MNRPRRKARVRRVQKMLWKVAVRVGRSEKTGVLPSRELYMFLEQPIAVGRVRKTMMVVRGMIPTIEHVPTSTRGMKIMNM